MIGSPLHTNLFYPLGFPLSVTTNSEPVLRTLADEYGAWNRLSDTRPLHLRIEVSGSAPALPPPAEFRAHRHLFAFVADSANFAVGDTSTGTASIWLTREAVEDSAYFHYHFLDGVVSLLIEATYLTPIHAACIARADRGVLLCGDSGAGKSTLAYACARRGWTYVTDDASNLIRARASDRLVVGNAHRVRLRPEAAQRFPELEAHSPQMRGNGKLTLELATRTLLSITANPTTVVHRMVFLQRKPDGPPRLKTFGVEQARAWCEQVFFHWNPAIAAEQSESIAPLLEGCEIQALEYAGVEDAVHVLER